MKSIFTLLLSCLVFAGFAQQTEEGDINTADLPKLSEPIKDKLDFNLSVGTSFMYVPKFGGSMSHFVAPQLTYNVSDKFRVSTGVLFQYSSWNNFQASTNESSLLFARPQYQFQGFVSGEYDVNEKLTLTGRVFAGSTALQVPGLNPDTYRYTTYGVAGGFRYKINEHASFSAEIQISKGNSPYMPGMQTLDGSQNSFSRMGPFGRSW